MFDPFDASLKPAFITEPSLNLGSTREVATGCALMICVG